MTDAAPDGRRLTIKKYSNRRFYDTSRSQHVTLSDMHALICEGYELTIIDSTTGDNITNLVLTQIILERDPPKLDIFPANILHQVIRTQQHFLGSVVEQFFRQALETQRASQERWLSFVRNTMGPAFTGMNPLDWTKSMMDAFGPRPAEPATAETAAPAEPPGGTGDAAGAAPGASEADEPEDEVDELRQQVRELTDRLEALGRRSTRKEDLSQRRRERRERE